MNLTHKFYNKYPEFQPYKSNFYLNSFKMQLENFNFRDKFDMLLGAVDNSMQLIEGKEKTGIMLVPTPTKSSSMPRLRLND